LNFLKEFLLWNVRPWTLFQPSGRIGVSLNRIPPIYCVISPSAVPIFLKPITFDQLLNISTPNPFPGLDPDHPAHGLIKHVAISQLLGPSQHFLQPPLTDLIVVVNPLHILQIHALECHHSQGEDIGGLGRVLDHSVVLQALELLGREVEVRGLLGFAV
jgi:hypothetical protein